MLKYICRTTQLVKVFIIEHHHERFLPLRFPCGIVRRVGLLHETVRCQHAEEKTEGDFRNGVCLRSLRRRYPHRRKHLFKLVFKGGCHNIVIISMSGGRKPPGFWQVDWTHRGANAPRSCAYSKIFLNRSIPP